MTRSPAPHANDDESESLLVRYVEQGLDMLEAGTPVDVAKLCAEHPHLATAVADALGLAPSLRSLQGGSGETDACTGLVLQERYRLDRRIGSGAMGAVYRARDLELKRDVAVKVLQPGIFRNEQSVVRFQREAEVLASLRHPNIVPIHDRGRSADGTAFLVMELLDGVSLAAVVRAANDRMPNGPTPELFRDAAWLHELRGIEELPEPTLLRLVVRWAADLANGLQAAHAAGVFHRDVKPSNVFITRQGRAVLLDFGIAARAGEGGLTLPGSTLGTPWYMAPEQATAQTSPHATMDVYGVCATLYHLLALRPPFEDEAARVLVRLQTEDPPRLGALHPGLAPDLLALIEKGMERDPRSRYQDVAALESDLDAFLDHRPVRARPLTHLARFARQVRRKPAKAAAIAGVFTTLLVLAILVPLWRARAAEQRHGQHDELVATIPALLGLEGNPEKRMLEDRSERDDAMQLLSRILDLEADDHATRLLRASLLLDKGDHAAAARDFTYIAERAASPYFRAIAQRYIGADDSKHGAQAVNLAELPEPSSDIDCFVAGFHALRMRGPENQKRAQELLARAMDTYLPARELHALAMLVNGHVNEAYEEAFWLEGRYGRKTARTRHLIGYALIFMDRFTEALGPLEEALALRPDRHSTLQNLAYAHFKLGNLDEAEKRLNEAWALRPWIWNTPYLMSQVFGARGDFDGALAWAERLPETGSDGEAWKRPHRIGMVHLERAYAEFWQGHHEAAAAAAKAAVTYFEQSLAAGGTSQVVDAARALAESVAAGDTSAYASLLEVLLLEPAEAMNIYRLAGVLTDELGAKQVDLLREYLLTLSLKLAPGFDAAERELDHLRARRAENTADAAARKDPPTNHSDKR